MEKHISVTAAPKTGVFQMRINPQVRQQAESVFAQYGLSLTDAFNIFLQQSLNESGLPFLLSPENEAFMKAKAAARLKAELQKGFGSVKTEADWVSEEEARRLLRAEE